MDSLEITAAVFFGSILMFIAGAICVIDEDPQMLTNDCMLYNEIYYCPTDIPEGLVMPVE